MSAPLEIRARRLVEADAGSLFEFLADLENHWRLAARFIEVETLERGSDRRSSGGTVRMRGPLGLHRTARTQVLEADPEHGLVGVAEVGPRTRAFVRWRLRGGREGTEVRLEATVDRAGLLDGLLLRLGGRRWLESRFAGALEAIDELPPAVTGSSARERRQPV
jgi:Polyketide cyclase / dehydrase and lipid transport